MRNRRYLLALSVLSARVAPAFAQAQEAVETYIQRIGEIDDPARC